MQRLLSKTFISAIALAAMLKPAVAEQNPALLKGEFAGQTQSFVKQQPAPTADIAPYVANFNSTPYSATTQARFIKALRERVKYVFVIFNENNSFDHEYGTFPGANGIYSDGGVARPPEFTPGFTQTYTDQSTGLIVTVQPFLMGPNENATFQDSLDHSHTGLARKIDVVNGVAQMDQFSYDEYLAHFKASNPAAEAAATQYARLVMSHVDCETIPFFWYWASRFTLFDNIFATEDTPSSPNAIAMLAGQSGETQWVEHPSNGITLANSNTGPSFPAGTPTVCGVTGGGTTQGVPVVNDPQPFYGSEFDTTALTTKDPAGCKESYGVTNISENLTFASLPLSFMGKNAPAITALDLNPSVDLADIQGDIKYLGGTSQAQVPWGWFQEGYDHEPTDTTPTASHLSYVSHHNGAQYFGYIANNPEVKASLGGLGDFFTYASKGVFPNGGVVYIRGGYQNIVGLTPPIQNPNFPAPGAFAPGSSNILTINASKVGDDDHPSYSDRQISEAMAARVINAVANIPEIWSQSAIIITYDESDGLWDHVPPHIQSYGPDGLPLSRGVRIPLLLISPYANAHAISSAEGDHNAVIQTINAIFNLAPLASLPNEAAALAAGNTPTFNAFAPAGFQQTALGPRDIPTVFSQSLLSGFDLDRLEGKKAPIPASIATIPQSVINSLPHLASAPGGACKAIGVEPEDKRLKIKNAPPAGFNTLPGTLPAYN